ncbi:class Ib ribonucleoside-diphosphate reductase assembly flavoprotein NrdI, partial [Bacillus inaquosorum]|nr:class Ib ribonucleoside-diphosphate reductase assembly flavoprotein NrdI [Bacillus inaquosorum]
MVITYESKTGNVRRFVKALQHKLDIEAMEITDD